ncbi:MAG: hypothetical protein H7Y03_14620, partial [Chitinophagaceae bacterium]|nr:hypothetical protein [Chitinophagaceae bacterium]
MISHFILVVTTSNPQIKPPLSDTACNYLARFVTEKVLYTKHIILGGDWSVMVGVIFSSDTQEKDAIALNSRVRKVPALHAKLHEIKVPFTQVERAL